VDCVDFGLDVDGQKDCISFLGGGALTQISKLKFERSWTRKRNVAKVWRNFSEENSVSVLWGKRADNEQGMPEAYKFGSGIVGLDDCSSCIHVEHSNAFEVPVVN
jgi:hypothetical protein